MQNYNFIQKLLHDLVLSNKLVNKSLFELEKFLYLKNNNIDKNSHVFITSLPRSGTTILLNFLFSSNEFASLKYSNMPFVLSPNFSKIFNKKNIKGKERLHSDGIRYDLNSPEAFDEVFFSINEKYVKEELINYINLILISQNKTRYLSKNNFNYKRINLIKSIIPNSIFLIPVREPLQHAYSLFKQHLHFSNLQKKDDFIRRYMNYLGHHEFGLDHKFWNKPLKFNDTNNINYWLEQWYLFYKQMQENYIHSSNCIFLIYENFSNSLFIKKIMKDLSLSTTDNMDINIFKNLNKKNINIKYDHNIYEHALKIYNNFH